MVSEDDWREVFGFHSGLMVEDERLPLEDDYRLVKACLDLRMWLRSTD